MKTIIKQSGVVVLVLLITFNSLPSVLADSASKNVGVCHQDTGVTTLSENLSSDDFILSNDEPR